MRHCSGNDYVGLRPFNNETSRDGRSVLSSTGPTGNGHSKTASPAHPFVPCRPLPQPSLTKAGAYYRVDSFKRAALLGHNDPAQVPRAEFSRRVSPFRRLFLDFENCLRTLSFADACSRGALRLDLLVRSRVFIAPSWLYPRYNSWTSIVGRFIHQLEIYRLRHHRGCPPPPLCLSFLLLYARVTLIACGIVSLTAVIVVALLLVRPLLPRGWQDRARPSRREIGTGETSLFATEAGAIFQACPFLMRVAVPGRIVRFHIRNDWNRPKGERVGFKCTGGVVQGELRYQTTWSMCYLPG